MLDINNPEELIKQAQAGDEAALARLYDNFYAPVYRYLYFRTRDRSETEDLAQETFLRFYRTLQKYQYRGTTPLAYLFRIARNCLIDAGRRKKSWIQFSELFGRSEEPRENPAEQRENAEMVKSALAELPEAEQEAVILRFVNDLPYSEIAQLTGRSEEAVRQAVSRALKRLREYFLKNNLL